MTITVEVRDLAAKNAPVETSVAAEEAEAGIAAMSELYMGAGDREHD